MKRMCRVVALIALVMLPVFGFAQNAVFPEELGGFSTYLVGTYDLRGASRTWITVINPTHLPHTVLVAFYDEAGRFQNFARNEIPPNGLWEIDVMGVIPPRSKPEYADFGVVKVISLGAHG